jgi:hypothetical protein
MPSALRFQILVSVAAFATSLLTGYAVSGTGSRTLAGLERFAAIGDADQRSAAIFTELGKVLTDPRCMNCHPAGDRPHQGQGDARRLHQPPVERGADGHGSETMRCAICHQSTNFDPGRVPGHPAWHLAPREMAWEGKTLAEICTQLKDPARNGGRKVEDLIDHIGKDTLVGWAWAPGYGRTPAPGTQQQAGALVAAWVQTGAACPAP